MILLKKGGIIIKFQSFIEPLYPLENFYARVPHTHPQKSYILSQLNNSKAGLQGELTVLRFLEEFIFPQNVTILHNYQAKIHSKWFIQIDYLILSRKGILLIEVKNISGHIRFQHNPAQIIRTYLDGLEDAMDCPFIQMDRNAKAIKQIIPSPTPLPIETCLVWANRKARLSIEKVPHPHSFIPAKALIMYLENYFEKPSIFSSQQLEQVKKHLMNSRFTSSTKSLCDKYKVESTELLKGLYCTNCFASLKKHVNTWVCPSCKVNAADQVEKNVLSQFSIVNTPIGISIIDRNLVYLTKKQIRYILKKHSVKMAGEKKSVVYSLN